MARVAGPSLAELRRRDDAYATRVVDAVRDTLRTVAAGVSDRPTADDVATVPTVWERHVDALLDGVADAYTLGVDAVQTGVARLLVGLRAAGVADVSADVLESVPRIANPEVEAYLVDARSRLTGLGNEVWEHVRGSVIDGVHAGDSTAGIRDRIVGATELAAPRAEVIARTETNGAANAGALAEMLATGLGGTKEWLATGGGRTRPTHLEADGQKVDLKDVFHVGGAAMERPLDPSGPPGEVINCRCSMGFDVNDDDVAGLAPWQPKMSLEDAEGFSADSAFRQTLYHGTPTTDGAESIMSSGFDDAMIGRGSGNRGWAGRGLYYTERPEYAATYAFNDADGRVLSTKVNVSNPWKSVAFQPHPDDPYSYIAKAGYGKLSRDEIADKIREEAERRGYDSIVVYGRDGKINELVVFDKKNVVVIGNYDPFEAMQLAHG